MIKHTKECTVVCYTENSLNVWHGKSDIMRKQEKKVGKRVGGRLKRLGLDRMKRGEVKRRWAELAWQWMSR